MGIVNGDTGVSDTGIGMAALEKSRNVPLPASTCVYSCPGNPPTSASIHEILFPGNRCVICTPPRIVVLSFPPNDGDQAKPRAGEKLFLSLPQMPWFGYGVPSPISAIWVRSPFWGPPPE